MSMACLKISDDHNNLNNKYLIHGSNVHFIILF